MNPRFIPPLLHRSLWGAWLAIISGLLIIAILVSQHPGGNLDITYDYGYIRCAVEFLIGLGIYRFYLGTRIPAFIISDYAIALCMTLLLMNMHFGGADIITVPLFAFLILALSLNTGHSKTLLDMPVFQFIGKISYPIYLLHGLIFLFFWNLIPYAQKEWGLLQLDGPGSWVFATVFLFLTIFLASLSYRHIELAYRKRLTKWFSARDPQHLEPASAPP